MSIIELHWSLHAGLPLLSVLQLLPLLGALLMLALRTWPHLARLGLLLATVELLLAVKLYLDYDPTSPAMQFAEWWHLFGPLDYHAAVDGVSLGLRYSCEDPAPECVTLAPGGTYLPPPWLGVVGDAQCDCLRCAAAPAGEYRFVVRSCNQAHTAEGESFALTDR